jgi:glycosyltransferase involved in cell wall biosynthesis
MWLLINAFTKRRGDDLKLESSTTRTKSCDLMQENVHLAFFITKLGAGGVGKMRIHLTHELTKRGVRVDLLLPKAEGPYAGALGPNVRVVELGTTHAIFSIPRLVGYLRRERPAALVTDTVRCNAAALRARRVARVQTRVCTSVHIPLSHKLRGLSQAKRRSQFASIRRFYPLNDRIFAVSRGVADDLIRNFCLPAEKVRVVYNPVITPEVFSLAQEPVHHAWFASTDVPIVISAGRLAEPKDFPTLIRAFAELRKTRRCRLLILGQGKGQARLQSMATDIGIAEDVELAGFAINPYKYIARANLLVLSSEWEGFGNVLVEAMALGVPVVSTDCPHGPREILRNGHYGPLVPVGNVDALAQAMEATLDHPLAAHVLRSGAGYYTAEACADGYLQAIGSM